MNARFPARVLPGCREAFALAERQARSVGPARSQNSFAARFPTVSRQAALAPSPQGPADGTSEAPAADGAAIDPLDLANAEDWNWLADQIRSAGGMAE